MCIINDDTTSNGNKCNNVMGKKKCMVKYLIFHNSSFAFRYFLNGNGKTRVWNTSSFLQLILTRYHEKCLTGAGASIFTFQNALPFDEEKFCWIKCLPDTLEILCQCRREAMWASSDKLPLPKPKSPSPENITVWDGRLCHFSWPHYVT